MALGTSVQITHKFVSGKADGADPTFVQPSKWNQPENVGAGSDGQIPVRDSSATEGASWVDAGAAYQVRGLVGNNNATTPNTKYDVAADLVVLRDPALKYSQTKASTGTITNDLGLAGPAANGRDQAGVFSANSWVHLYFIAKPDGTLATVSSTVAPPTGPTLPTGYTMWAYIAGLRFNASSQLGGTHLRGSWVWYDSEQTPLANGTATVETAISIAALVPPNALVVDAIHASLTQNTVAINDTWAFRVISGVTFMTITIMAQNDAQFWRYNGAGFRFPNVAQNFFYLWTLAPDTTKGVTISVHGYQVPNGGE